MSLAATRQVREERIRPAEAIMESIVLDGPQQFSLVRSDPPDPGPNQVRLKLEGCGVCGSNLPVWEGRPWFQYPLEPGAPGHEGWGVVDAVGDGVMHVAPGDRVAALSYRAFATHDVADANAVVPLPSSLDGPFPGEPLACAVNVMRRANVSPGERVAVVGVGFLGALVTDLAVKEGGRVIAISRRPFALDLATEAGAEAVINMRDAWHVAEEVQRLAPDGCDCVIEAVGNQLALDVAGALVRVRGRLVIAGYHQDGPRQVNMQDWNWKGIDVINAHERDPAIYLEGLRLAVDMAARREWAPDRYLTHKFELGELSAAMALMQERPDGFLKSIIVC